MDPVTLGAIGMGVSSLASGYFGGEAQKEASEAQARAQIRAQKMAIEEQRNAYGDVEGYYDPYRQHGEASLGQLGALQGEWDVPNMPTMGQYQYGGDVQDFLDPSMQFQQDEAMRAMQSQYGQDQYSGSAMKALQDRAQQMAQTDYGNAYGRMERDKAFDYQDYINQFNNQRANVSDQYNRLSDQYNRALGGVNIGANAVSGTANARMGASNQIGNMMNMQGKAQGQYDASGPLATASHWQTFTNPNVMGPAVAGMAGMFQNQAPASMQASGEFQPQMGNIGMGGQYAMANPMQGNLSPQLPQQQVKW